MPVSVANFGSISLRVSSSEPVRTCSRRSTFVLPAGAAEVGWAAVAGVGAAPAAGLVGAAGPPQAARNAPAAARPPSKTRRRGNDPFSCPRMVILRIIDDSLMTMMLARNRPRHEQHLIDDLV